MRTVAAVACSSSEGVGVAVGVAVGAGVSVGVAVGGKGVSVGGTAVAVAGSGVAVSTAATTARVLVAESASPSRLQAVIPNINRQKNRNKTINWRGRFIINPVYRVRG